MPLYLLQEKINKKISRPCIVCVCVCVEREREREGGGEGVLGAVDAKLSTTFMPADSWTFTV